MENSFTSLIESAQSILIVLPVKPDFDSVAGGLALYLSLHDLAVQNGNKEVSIICPTPMMVGFNRIIGINKISDKIGNKNLVISFTGYDGENIERVRADIENKEFKLTVLPKAGFVSPQKEQIVFGYEGVAADLVILIGGANDGNFPILSSEDVAGAKIAHIGNRSITSAREILSFASPGSSESEVISNIIKEVNLPIDPDVATDLVMGIEEGSDNFSLPDVSPETFETFAFLLRNGGVRLPKVKLSAKNFPQGSIPTKPFGVNDENLDASDFDGTVELETDINPPDDWLKQPKIFKGSSVPSSDSFSENKG